ncbi:hypothetical protein GCM10027345_31100 [Hymenobacter daeguensis]
MALYSASPANDAEQHGNDGNDQQNVNDAARNEAPEEAYSPDDDQNDGDDIQEVAHGFEEVKKYEGEVKNVREVSLGHCTGHLSKGYNN